MKSKAFMRGHQNWRAVGGKNKAIRAFQRPEGSGSQTALQHLMGDVPIMDPPVEDIASLMGTIIDQVSDYKNYSNAIGYTFRYYSTEMTKNNGIRLLAIDGVEPTKETIRQETIRLRTNCMRSLPVAIIRMWRHSSSGYCRIKGRRLLKRQAMCRLNSGSKILFR